MGKKTIPVCPEQKKGLSGEYGLNLKQVAASLGLTDSTVAENFKTFFISAIRQGLEGYRFSVEVKHDQAGSIDRMVCTNESGQVDYVSVLTILAHSTGRVGRGPSVIDYELVLWFIEEQLVPNIRYGSSASEYLEWLRVWGKNLKKQQQIPPLEYADMLVVSEVPDKTKPVSSFSEALRNLANDWDALVAENTKLKSKIASLSTGSLGEVLTRLSEKDEKIGELKAKIRRMERLTS